MTDGGSEFTTSVTQDFLTRWGVRHRFSSAHHPQSNGRAEVAVKSAKRLLRSNTGPSGILDTDAFLRAIVCCSYVTPRTLTAASLFAFAGRLEKFSALSVRPIWRHAWQAKETALKNRFHRTTETLNEQSTMCRAPSADTRDHASLASNH